jgi:uncharacterized protein with PQ loop repeat
MTAPLGLLAAALSISVVWPQVWRSCRHGRTLGLSPTTAWLGIALNLCWLTFGLLIGDPAQIVTNTAVGAGNTAVLVALLVAQPHLRTGRMLLRTAVGAAALACLAAGSLLSVAILDASPAAVAGALSAVVSVVNVAAGLPQPLSLLRNRRQDVSGLSAARWRLGAGSCASWVGYGWLIGQPAVSLSAAFGRTCALVMCALLRTRRGTRPAGARTRVRPALTAVPGCRVPVRPALAAA